MEKYFASEDTSATVKRTRRKRLYVPNVLEETNRRFPRDLLYWDMDKYTDFMSINALSTRETFRTPLSSGTGGRSRKKERHLEKENLRQWLQQEHDRGVIVFTHLTLELQALEAAR